MNARSLRAGPKHDGSPRNAFRRLEYWNSSPPEALGYWQELKRTIIGFFT
jgi:hypothetical protein